MPSLTPDSSAGSISLNIVAAILYGLAIWGGNTLYSRFAGGNPSYRRPRLLLIILCGVALNALSFILLGAFYWVFLLTSIIIMSVVLYREINQFWQIGLVGIDRELTSGLHYAAALDLCKHSLRFLGIGAAKLTANQPVFREAIERCNRTEPVKLLLSRPDAPELERFATMAGKSKETYQRTVRDSLRFIAGLHNDEEKNIEVRFYQQFPAFRLMFIDESICLMSYYVMGKGDGSNLPQLHIVKPPGLGDLQALYFGFNEYFDKMWEDSKVWDFREFL